MTTPFASDGSIDGAFLAKHASWLVDHGSTGIVAPGSLGEGATLSRDEKRMVWETLVAGVGTRVPVIGAIAALSTREAVELAGDAQRAGCRGLMVLPAYVYKGDWQETRAHFSSVIDATGLSCMVYNNPIAYGTDVLPEQAAELAQRHPNLHAIKESSADVRRITGLRAILGDRLAVLVGVDDLIVEGIAAGACGWIAGLVNAFPKESVALFDLCVARKWDEAARLYAWFLPLLRMDVVPEFVQLIKLVQQEVGMGSERVRAPRRSLTGTRREEAVETIRRALANRA
jgi:4-hydroxy-tetrahydrodipicolinate synthase